MFLALNTMSTYFCCLILDGARSRPPKLYCLIEETSTLSKCQTRGSVWPRCHQSVYRPVVRVGYSAPFGNSDSNIGNASKCGMYETSETDHQSSNTKASRSSFVALSVDGSPFLALPVTLSLRLQTDKQRPRTIIPTPRPVGRQPSNPERLNYQQRSTDEDHLQRKTSHFESIEHQSQT